MEEYFRNYESELCEDCKNRLSKNPLRILDCKIDHEKEFIKNAPSIYDFLTDEAKDYFEKVQAYLTKLEIPYEIDSSLVRGLDYYTDTVFEVISTHSESGSQSTIFGGGRYDGLVEELGGPAMSGIGFAIGEERLIILGDAEGIFDDGEAGLDSYVIDMTDASPYTLEVASIIRANAYSCEVNFTKRSMKSQFKSCERKKARFIIIIGEDEVKDEVVTVKDTIDQSQAIVKLDELIDYLDRKMQE